MKLAGALIIVASGFTVGAMRRSNMLAGERLTSLLAELLTDIKYTLVYNSGSLIDAIVRLSQCERYQPLSFIAAALDNARERGPGTALAEALCEWEGAKALTRDDREAVAAVFSALGSDGVEREKQKLENAAALLRDSAARRLDENQKKRGYYETLFTLAGAAAAIALL